MKNCNHEQIDIESYDNEEYYGRWTIVTIVKCSICGEILEETKEDLK